MNVLSLFDGMSVGQIALNKVGITNYTYYASEIKKDGILFTENQIFNVGNIDLLIGGSPCQNLSIAMAKEHRKGLEGDKSGLFYEYFRIFKEVKPKYFLLENVGSMDKKDEDIITELLDVRPIKINSKLVSAQLRNRIYWTNIPNIIQPQDKEIKLKNILIDGYSDRDKARCLLESESRPLTTPLKMFHRYFSTGFTTLIFKSQEHYLDCVRHYNNNFKNMSAQCIDRVLENENIDISIYSGCRYLNQSEMEIL